MTVSGRISMGAVAAAAVFAVATTGTMAGQQPAGRTGSNPDAVKRGEYLVTSIGCGDCHTPFVMGPGGPEPDKKRTLSGHPSGSKLPAPPALSSAWNVAVSASGTAWHGPWGTSYTANLTPHDTGLGTWTEQQFVDAIRTGRHQGRGRQILPPMPWQAFSHLTDADLKAIWAYLQSIPPIENKVPDPVIAGPPPAKPVK